jgi:hypothetical protein
LRKLEEAVAWTTKVSVVSAAVAVLVGGGGVLGYVQYFSEAPKRQRLDEIELAQQESKLYTSLAHEDENRGEKQKADHFHNLADGVGEKYAASHSSYVPIPIPLEISQPSQTTKEEILRSLPNKKVEMAVGVLSHDGNFDYRPMEFLLKSQHYRLTWDCIIYRLERAEQESGFHSQRSIAGNPTSDYAGFRVVGVGVRVVADVVAQGEVRIDSLFSLGVAANRRLIQGTIGLETIGITGPDIMHLAPLPQEISSSSVTNIMTSVERIMQSISEPDVKLKPQAIGLLPFQAFPPPLPP